MIGKIPTSHWDFNPQDPACIENVNNQAINCLNISPQNLVTSQGKLAKFFRKKPKMAPTLPELSFLQATCHLNLFFISTKFHQNIPKGIRATERIRNLFQTKQREITLKLRKPELAFLYMKSRLVLLYISIKYNQNMPKGIQVTERTRSFMLTSTMTRTPTGSIRVGGWGGGGG